MTRFRSGILIVSCIVACAPVLSHAQDSVRTNASSDHRFSDDRQVGVFGGYPAARHNAEFSQLPGVANCSQNFGDANGGGFYFGGLYQIPLRSITRGLALQLRAGYSSVNGSLAAPEVMGFALDPSGNVVQATGVQTLDPRLGILQFEPLVSFAPFKFPLALNVGPGVGLLLGKSFTEQEQVTSPSNVHFVNGGSANGQIRNAQQGTIQQTNAIVAELYGGLSYDFPIGPNWILSPEVGYALGLTSIIKGANWKVNSARFGASLKMLLPSSSNALDPDAPPLAEIRAVGLTEDGKELPDVHITIEEFLSTNSYPLFNCVFFDENSADIPSRYHLLRTSADASGFQESQSAGAPGKLSFYYDMLNILGKRMQEKPSANMMLTGYNCGQGPEKNNVSLSKRRAEAISEYLKSRFNIADSRIKIDAENLPPNPSAQQDPQGMQENRRVEIASDDPSLLLPLVVNSVDRTINPPAVRFYPTAMDPSPLETWEVSAAQSGKRLFDTTGSPEPGKSMDWQMAGAAGKPPTTGDPLDCLFEFNDAKGRSVRSTQFHLPVKLLTIQKKREEKLGDHVLSRYRLLLFQYGKSQLDPLSQTQLDSIKANIKPNSKLTITGYTDKIGDEEFNRKLSVDRANSVAENLGVRSTATISGVGKKVQLYDQQTPEGRFYNRTVDVLVETPQ